MKTSLAARISVATSYSEDVIRLCSSLDVVQGEIKGAYPHVSI